MIKKLNEHPKSQSNQYQSTLSYYKDKVDGLGQQRMTFLSKCDECSSKLQHKHNKQQKLKNLKDQTADTIRSIIHNSIAYFDERAHAISMDRDKKGLQFEDAEQILKIKQLSEEYPSVLEKQIPCKDVFLTDQVIHNELNIHSTGKRQKSTKKGSKQQTKYDIREEGKKIIKASPTFESLLKQQIIETKKLNEQEMKVMQEQAEALQNMISDVKQRQQERSDKERGVINQFNKKYKRLQQKHKQLAEAYFQNRRKLKKQYEGTQKQNQSLKQTQANFQSKVQLEIKKYQKQNKAKQTLIIKRSQDFQEDYKAKMRAKEHNLQALKQNYEKMQELCITKVRKLEATLERAKNLLRDTEQSRNFTVEELRQQLKILQKRVGQQRLEKAKLDIKLKEKIQMKRRKQEIERQKMQRTRKMEQKSQQMLTAYQKTKKGHRNSRSKQRRAKKAENEEEDSLDMSDLDNIRQQINELEQKIAKEDKHYA